MKKTSKRKVKLTDQQKEQNLHKREIRTLLKNIGYTRITRIEGKEFIYDNRTSELDDIFYYENIILLVEYTVGKPNDHLLKKKIIYDKINNDKMSFIQFLMDEEKFKHFNSIISENILKKYQITQIQLKIVYASKQSIASEHKENVPDVKYFDYPIVKYFESIAKVIKKSAAYEFHDFLSIDNTDIGENILQTTAGSSNDYLGHILPEEHSSYKTGYKLISFYIDASSLMKRVYVLRKNGWRSKEHIGFYQRMLNAAKINAMRKYLNDEGRVFVNNIVATLPEEKVKLYDSDDNEIKIDANGYISSKNNTKVQPAKIRITDEVNIIGIVDGQHRTFAYHEGTDKYEEKISQIRKIQNLLITGILFPQNERERDRRKFEAKLFLEINSNQQSASTALKHEIEAELAPFSSTSIAKFVINKLNDSGPLSTLFELYFYERNKIKTSTIISFGLKPLLKFDGIDSLYSLWDNTNKEDLKKKENDELLEAYKVFCIKEIRLMFEAFKSQLSTNKWEISRLSADGVLGITFINGVINCLRKLIENKETGDKKYYEHHLKDIDKFDFKKYKTSHYRKMGEDLYNKYFKPQ